MVRCEKKTTHVVGRVFMGINAMSIHTLGFFPQVGGRKHECKNSRNKTVLRPPHNAGWTVGLRRDSIKQKRVSGT